MRSLTGKTYCCKRLSTFNFAALIWLYGLFASRHLNSLYVFHDNAYLNRFKSLQAMAYMVTNRPAYSVWIISTNVTFFFELASGAFAECFFTENPHSKKHKQSIHYQHGKSQAEIKPGFQGQVCQVT